jgi:cytoskeletal protein RodZ
MIHSAWWGQSFVKELARISDQSERKHRIIRPSSSTLPIIGKVPGIVNKVSDILSKDRSADTPSSSKEQDAQPDASVVNEDPQTPNPKAANEYDSPNTKSSNEVDTPSTNNEPKTPVPIIESEAPPLKKEVTPIGSFPESPGA